MQVAAADPEFQAGNLHFRVQDVSYARMVEARRAMVGILRKIRTL